VIPFLPGTPQIVVFKNRAVRFGIIFAFTFPLHVPDSQDSSPTLANWLAACFYLDAERRVQILLECVALVLIMTAFIRTWASAYLHVEVVHAAAVKTQSLVAGGTLIVVWAIRFN
jgi:hypothetical protein